MSINQDRTAIAQVAVAGKLPLSMGTVDEKLCRPPPPGTPGIMDPNILRYI